MSAALERGLTLSDFEEMEIGAIVDYVITFNNLHYKEDTQEDTQKENKDKVIIRKATQDDWDGFSS